MTVYALLKCISSGRQCLGNLTSILMNVLPGILFILLLTDPHFASNSSRCGEERNFPHESMSVKKKIGLLGVKSLILWKRLVRQSMTVDGSASLEKSLHVPTKQTTNVRAVSHHCGDQVGQGWQTVIPPIPNHSIQMVCQSLQNKKLASCMRMRRWRLSSLT